MNHHHHQNQAPGQQGGFAPQHQGGYAPQQQSGQHQQSTQPIDKGYLIVVIGQFHKKQNGQALYKPGTNEPVLSNKYMAIGEITRWPNQEGGYYDDIEFYPGVMILETNRKARIFWNSQNQQPAQSQSYR